MNSPKKLDKYKGFPLYIEAITTKDFKKYLETCLTLEDEARDHSFHKILVNHWPENLNSFISAFSDYFGFALIPVNVVKEDNDKLSFYSSNLNLISKIIELNFLFPYQKCMSNIEILFNCKTSIELFGKYTTVDEIVTKVVSNRFKGSCELDLSAFCEDKEFLENKIYFYKLSLLSHFKILMLRMGRDTKSLNLSCNNLSNAPMEILNFFMKGNLTSINLSHNRIPSLNQVPRVNSKIEKLWMEENPLCETLDASTYIKDILFKFPRLLELDGVKLNHHRTYLPSIRNFVVPAALHSNHAIDEFLAIFFSYYDDPFRHNRKYLANLYDVEAKFSISTCFTSREQRDLPHYMNHTRNIMDMSMQACSSPGARIYNGEAVLAILTSLPETIHDPTTFSIDVLLHNEKTLVLVVDGVFKEKSTTGQDKILQFRRTFVFTCRKEKEGTKYLIANDMLTVTTAANEHKLNSFKNPIRNGNTLMLINPTADDVDNLVNIFCRLTKLKAWAAKERLRACNWDIRKSLSIFIDDLKKNDVPNFFLEFDERNALGATASMEEID